MIRLTSEKSKKIGIFGLARTGIAVYKSLAGIADLVCWDDNESNRASINPSDLYSLEDNIWGKLDYIVLSPGIPLHFPKPHKVVEIARANSINITSDIELLYKARPSAKYIGITGTNGKSTTTSLIGHILGNTFSVGGNIGDAALDISDAKGFVLELSSYQLDLMSEFKPNVAVLLNITPDHIDRHGSLEGYIEAKKRIWRNMSSLDTLVIGIDNEITESIYRDLTSQNASFNIIPFSSKNSELVLPYNEFLLGMHNRENMLAAYMATKAMGYEDNIIFDKISTFKGLKHRLQFIGSYRNIKFYNDSKATNAASTFHALNALENIYWLAGGVPKEGGIMELMPLMHKVKKAYLYGQSKEEFANTLIGKVDFVVSDTMEEVMNKAVLDAKKSLEVANILLSPACASFDQFKSFEDRGDEFIKLASTFCDF